MPRVLLYSTTGRGFALVAAGLLLGAERPAALLHSDDELLSLIRARVDAGRNVGIVVGVIGIDGRQAVASYGKAGPGALPLDRDSVFEIGSITKVFTTTLFAEMIERGEVGPDDPIGKFLPPGVRVPSRGGRVITLADLASHTSGLPRMMTNFHPADSSNPYADYTVKNLYEFLSSYELTRGIGSQYEYSNVGMGLLGHLLTVKAGKTYEALVTERILQPLGMRRTAIAMDDWMQKHLVRGHDNGNNPVPNWDVRTIEGAGALRSTVNDMLRFAAANVESGSDPLHRAMARAQAPRAATGRPDLSIGLGWHIRQVNGRAITWHNGGTGGYRTWIGFDKSRRMAAVVLTNSTHGADDLGYELLK